MKFSIVIPVYNVEKYIGKCLESILNQTYDNFEVIVVNDGSPDNSQKIIDKYVKKDKRIKSYIKENGGLSDARNYGLNYCTGDYLLFIDSDDYIEKELLKELEKIINKKKYEVIKFKLNLVNEDSSLIRKESGFDISKEINLEEILSQEFSEPACCYCYNMKFFKKEKFMYAKDKIHEDFGLTPLILFKAKNIYYLNYYGYNYVQRQGSIVNGATKNVKRANDMLYHFDFLYNEIIKDNSKKDKSLIISYIANGTISISSLLKGKDLTRHIKKLKKRKVFDLLLSNNLKRKIKKLIIKISPVLYIKLFLKRG